MFPETKSRLTSGLEGNPEGPYIKCFVMYLDFLLYNHIAKTNKQRRRAGNDCAIVCRSGSGARDQESTNHSARFVE